MRGRIFLPCQIRGALRHTHAAISADSIATAGENLANRGRLNLARWLLSIGHDVAREKSPPRGQVGSHDAVRLDAAQCFHLRRANRFGLLSDPLYCWLLVHPDRRPADLFRVVVAPQETSPVCLSSR